MTGTRGAGDQPPGGPPPPSGLPGPHQSVFAATLAQQALYGGAAPLQGGPASQPGLARGPLDLQASSWPHPLHQMPAGGAPPMPLPAAAAALADPQVEAAKAAAAREKNRLAQQRFRERQRAKQKEAGEQCEVLAVEIDQLERDNERLQRQNRMYERVLAVRDAMMQTFGTLQSAPPRQERAVPAQLEEQQAPAALPGAATASAAQGFERALHELPTEAEMEEAALSEEAEAPLVDESAGQEASPSSAAAAAPPRAAGDSRASAADGGDAMDELQLGGEPPKNLLGEAHRTGTADVLDGSALERVELVPPPSNQLYRAKILAMRGPEDLLAYVHEWHADLRTAWLAAEAAGFGREAVAELEGVVDRMTQMWFHVAQIQPAYLSYLACKMYPENSAQLPVWREIASEVMPHIDERGRIMVRRSWHTYCKRLTKTAVGVARWVQRLREITVQEQVASLADNAARALELAEVASHIKAAVQEEYIASVELVAAQFPVSTTLTKAYVNYRSMPYLPDLVAIVHQILCLENEERCQGYPPAITSGHAHPKLEAAPPPQAEPDDRAASGEAAQP